MNSVYIVGGDSAIKDMFLKRGWEVVQDISVSADLVVFTGGHDVTPSLYGERNFASYNSKERDELERLVYNDCIDLAIPMAGICRGGQFLNVMNGGRMYQDVNSHAIRGTHPITDLDTGDTVQVTSTHHQMMIPNYDKAEVIAIANLGGGKRTLDRNGNVTEIFDDNDTEVVWYDETDSLCFQPHPEYGVGSCERYFFNLLEKKLGF